MKVITVIQKVCEYLQLNEVREYAKNLEDYYEKLKQNSINNKEDLGSEITNESNSQENTGETNSQDNVENGNETLSQSTDLNNSDSQSEQSTDNESQITKDETESGVEELTKPTASEEVLFDFNVLLECFNNVMKHIAMKYCPLYYREFVDVVEGFVDLDKLKYNPYKIRRICDEFNDYKIRVVDGLIPLVNGNYLIEYQYVPESLSENDDVINFNNKLLMQGYIYGINSEYSLIRGDQTGSKMWDDKYVSLMQDVSQDISNVVIKRRRWI